MVQALDDCYPGQPGGCEWTIQHLWRGMSSFGRLDVIVLALLLIYLIAVVIHVYCRFYLARGGRGIDRRGRRKLVGFLNTEGGSLKSIVITAPYLGLAGTCEGILSAFGGMGMEKHTAMIIISTRIALALIPTAVGIPVGVLATSSYNYLRTRIDVLERELFDEGQQRDSHFRGARRLAATKRFSGLPALGLLAAPTLVIAIAGFMTFASFREPTGFYVELAQARCDHNVNDKLIVLRITGPDKLFLNQEQEDWSGLAGRLSEIYSMRKDCTLYLYANSAVPYQTVARALDILENVPATVGQQAVGIRKDKLAMKVRLVTPKALGCPTIMMR